ncbi:MAG TPA: bifunctional diaminohydroxyphosphoribosylaminopyrimidine deaminase/5-amino-6-(5-phosphoribosylamino)uracil reductase RibD, partial [Fimbriimonadaceae bacterium]
MKASKAEEFMGRAIELSQLGFPAPNPHVGCVIARDGEVVGEGYHDHAGGPHAEVVALNQAGPLARGDDVFVTLEPCNHHGRTGPCSLALIEAGVSSVSYAVADPNPRAQGGAERLRKAGIAVSQGLLEAEASAANSVFLTAIKLGRPLVTLKAAASLDGKIALENGESKWITGPRAREQGHRLRAEMGAVLVGANTVLHDDPELMARIEGVVNQPVRVILDPLNRVPATAKALQNTSQVLHFVGEKPLEGQTLIGVKDGKFDLAELLGSLWEHKIIGVLVEGGAHTIGSFFEADLYDRLELFLAPLVIGTGLSW